MEKKLLFPSTDMALTLCFFICLPVVFVNIDMGIARAGTESVIDPHLAKRIISIKTEKGDHVFKVHIIADGKLKDYNSFRLLKPHRFVIDLPDTKSSAGQKTWIIDSPLVKKIRVGTSYKDKVRVVFDLFAEAEIHYKVKVFSKDDQLVVVFGSGSASPTGEHTHKVQQTSYLSATDSHGQVQSTLPLGITGEAEREEGRTYYDLGVFAYEDGDYGDAEKNFMKALKFNPVNPYYNRYLGKTYLKTERYQDAENYLNMAWNVNPNISGLKYDVAILNYKIARYSKAADLFSEIVKEDPSNVLAHYHAGINLYKQKRYEEAVDYFIGASEKSPSIKANGYYYAGICFKKMGKIEEAVEKLEYVRDHADSELLRENAKKWLKAIEVEKKAMKPYSIYLKIGYQYDDNVRVVPLDQDIYADEGDFVFVGY